MPTMPAASAVSISAPEAPKVSGFGSSGPFASNLKGFDMSAVMGGDSGFKGFDFGEASSGFAEAFKEGGF